MTEQANEVQIPVPGIDTSAANLTDAQRTLIRAGLLRGSAQTAWVLERMLSAAEDANGMLKEALKRADAQLVADAVLKEAIAWALGEKDDFRAREPGEGAYWWRKELRERAALASTAPVAENMQPPTNDERLRMYESDEINGGSK